MRESGVLDRSNVLYVVLISSPHIFFFFFVLAWIIQLYSAGRPAGIVTTCGMEGEGVGDRFLKHRRIMQQSNKKMVKRRRKKKKLEEETKPYYIHRHNKTKSGESCKCDEAEKSPRLNDKQFRGLLRPLPLRRGVGVWAIARPMLIDLIYISFWISLFS